ncbi:hypothetical protein DhcVS_525 [Dehalococcoides mccartyi VS]|uniref:Uncharacterized protein n=1 Tax=Dehalococcoides mccartyi (strain VS) TaxID=311424 RepID=D2BH78_DEHMV|nr:hypothetical protein DhcVS_525 [Dehalococcoides mccartyi VS]
MFEIYSLYNCELNKESRVQAENYRRLHPTRPAKPEYPLILPQGKPIASAGKRTISHHYFPTRS